jgi:hypothetical protein
LLLLLVARQLRGIIAGETTQRAAGQPHAEGV